MNNEHRDRQSGWEHAKHSGHKNECAVAEYLKNHPAYLQDLLYRTGNGEETVKLITIGGIHETNVKSVIGNRSTKSKTDMKIVCNSGKTINISIKKSLGGQVYLVGAKSFIDVFQKQFHKNIPEDVKKAILLYWSGAEDANEIIDKYSNKSNAKNFNVQKRHKSLNADTLLRYNKILYENLLNWFSENMYEISKLSFMTGAASQKKEWAEFVWYINKLGEHDIDAIYRIEDLCKVSAEAGKKEVSYGSKNGGTTILLPFGFVQWHQRKMQFHHQHDKIKKILGK